MIYLVIRNAALNLQSEELNSWFVMFAKSSRAHTCLAFSPNTPRRRYIYGLVEEKYLFKCNILLWPLCKTPGSKLNPKCRIAFFFGGGDIRKQISFYIGILLYFHDHYGEEWIYTIYIFWAQWLIIIMHNVSCLCLYWILKLIYDLIIEWNNKKILLRMVLFTKW